MRRAGLLLALTSLCLAAPSPAAGERFAVGVEAGVRPEALAGRVSAATGNRVSLALAGLGALVVEAPSARPLRRLPGVAYVESLRPRRRLAFAPFDPLARRQYYLRQIRAFDFWTEPPLLPPVRVALIDSGIDAGHPELAGKVVAARSFVGGSPRVDLIGHGTFVAGVIAAAIDNDRGIAGIAPTAELVVAKVVRPDASISAEAEARAIRWAVDQGARVINLSLGGVRDPLNPGRDSYSPLEHAAVEYAVRRGVVVVAAVGNSDEAPRTPWDYASYPAALPHVLGVSALTRFGGVPDFSHRDAIYNDIAAPGRGILSTLPRALTARSNPGCRDQGYSSCGPPEYRRGEGTSFAAPQVSAAAALLFALRPTLAPEQVTALLEHSARDANAGTGCERCLFWRDRFSGWGRLDVTAAIELLLSGRIPARDGFEPNDDAGRKARLLWGRRRSFSATLDYWNDQNDVYRVRLAAGDTFYASLSGPADSDLSLALWEPGTRELETFPRRRPLERLKLSTRPGPQQRFLFRARADGFYYLQVKVSSPSAGRYRLAFSKT